MRHIIITIQDLQAAESKPQFILDAINKYKSSEPFRIAKRNYNYYRRHNELILAYLGYLERTGLGQKLNIVTHRLCNGMFQKFVNQRVSFTIGNGISLGDNTSKIMPVIGGSKFNVNIRQSVIAAAWGGISWNFMQFITPTKYELKYFTALNSFGLLDEEDGTYKAVITFGQLDETKPLRMQLFEIEGISKYVVNADGKTALVSQEVTPYKTKYTPTVLGREAVEGENYPSFPVVPLYFNMLKEPALSNASKATIDAYDFVNSDLVNSQTQYEGLYWELQNYNGEKPQETVERIQKFRAVMKDEGAGTAAKPFNVEAPWQGKQATLDSLKREAYDEFQALDTKSITGGSLTNVAINAATYDIGFAADELEEMVCGAIDEMLNIIGVQHEETSYKRRTITNDTETVNNIIALKDAELLDVTEATDLNPLVMESRKADLLVRLELQNTGVPPDDTEITDEV